MDAQGWVDHWYYCALSGYLTTIILFFGAVEVALAAALARDFACSSRQAGVTLKKTIMKQFYGSESRTMAGVIVVC